MPQHPIVSRKYIRKGRENWRVRVPDDLWEKGEIRYRNFLVEKDAVAFAASLQSARKELSARFLKLSPQKQGEILKRYEEENRRVNVTVAAAAEKCLAFKASENVRANSLIAFRCSINSLCRAFGEKKVGDITVKDISDWLALHPEWSPKTKLNNLKYARCLFAWFEKMEYRMDNPAKKVALPRVPFKGVTILSVQDIQSLLWAMQRHDPALLGFACLVLFGGLRVAESARCRPENVAKGVIDLGGEATKLNLRRCIKISAQLAAWLAVPGVEIGGKKIITLLDISDRHREILLAGGILNLARNK